MMNNKVFGLILGVLVGFFSALIYFFFILPQLLKMKGDLRISFAIFSKKECEGRGADRDNLSETTEMMENNKNMKIILPEEAQMEGDESNEIKRVFRPLQILAACFGALSHGSNDVGNCIGKSLVILK